MSQDEELKRLLEIAKKNHHVSVETHGKKLKTVVDQFIDEFDIKDGNTKVPAVIIYDTFIRWVKDPKQKISQTQFFNQFKSMFASYNSSGVRGYMLNNVFDTSKEAYLQALSRKRQYEEKKEKSKKQG